jgi:MtfA peptidase
VVGALPPFCKMQPELQRQLLKKIQLFIAEKVFEGCNGLVVTDEMRVTIAAQACLLLLGRRIACYPHLDTILVYPTAYVDNSRRMLSTDEHDRGTKAGESWQAGSVVLAWDHVLAGITNYEDGHNVTFHEFAHQLDQLDGNADGAPPLESWSAAATWSKVFTREYKGLIAETLRGRRSVLDAYGATHPAEFFAVATEAFFEKPRQLLLKHEALYHELKSYYCVDPIDWL